MIGTATGSTAADTDAAASAALAAPATGARVEVGTDTDAGAGTAASCGRTRTSPPAESAMLQSVMVMASSDGVQPKLAASEPGRNDTVSSRGGPTTCASLSSASSSIIASGGRLPRLGAVLSKDLARGMLDPDEGPSALLRRCGRRRSGDGVNESLSAGSSRPSPRPRRRCCCVLVFKGP